MQLLLKSNSVSFKFISLGGSVFIKVTYGSYHPPNFFLTFIHHAPPPFLLCIVLQLEHHLSKFTRNTSKWNTSSNSQNRVQCLAHIYVKISLHLVHIWIIFIMIISFKPSMILECDLTPNTWNPRCVTFSPKVLFFFFLFGCPPPHPFQLFFLPLAVWDISSLNVTFKILFSRLTWKCIPYSLD